MTSGRALAAVRTYGCDHLFEPLLRWVNDKLATAVAIALLEYDGATEAKLVYVIRGVGEGCQDHRPPVKACNAD
jgi:hypothetical protein